MKPVHILFERVDSFPESLLESKVVKVLKKLPGFSKKDIVNNIKSINIIINLNIDNFILN